MSQDEPRQMPTLGLMVGEDVRHASVWPPCEQESRPAAAAAWRLCCPALAAVWSLLGPCLAAQACKHDSRKSG